MSSKFILDQNEIKPENIVFKRLENNKVGPPMYGSSVNYRRDGEIRNDKLYFKTDKIKLIRGGVPPTESKDGMTKFEFHAYISLFLDPEQKACMELESLFKYIDNYLIENQEDLLSELISELNENIKNKRGDKKGDKKSGAKEITINDFEYQSIIKPAEQSDGSPINKIKLKPDKKSENNFSILVKHIHKDKDDNQEIEDVEVNDNDDFIKLREIIKLGSNLTFLVSANLWSMKVVNPLKKVIMWGCKVKMNQVLIEPPDASFGQYVNREVKNTFMLGNIKNKPKENEKKENMKKDNENIDSENDINNSQMLQSSDIMDKLNSMNMHDQSDSE